MPKNRDPTLITNVSFFSFLHSRIMSCKFGFRQLFCASKTCLISSGRSIFFFVIHDGGDNVPDFVSACLIFSWTYMYIYIYIYSMFLVSCFFLGGNGGSDPRKFQQALDFGCLAGRGSDKSSRETGVRTQQWFHILQALSWEVENVLREWAMRSYGRHVTWRKIGKKWMERDTAVSKNRGIPKMDGL